MKFVETGVKWIENQFAEKAFSAAILKCQEFAYSQKEKRTVEDIRSHFFAKYQKKLYYDDLDSYITKNNCIEFAVKYANSTQPKEQRLNAQYSKYHTQKFLENYPKRKIYREEIEQIFEIIRDMALEELNLLNNGSDGRAIQATIVRESCEVQNQLHLGIESLSTKIKQGQLSIVTAIQDAFLCEDDELVPFYKRAEEIKEGLQLKGSYKEAISEYNACYQEATLSTQGKNGTAINFLLSKVLSNIAICYANLGQYQEAKDTLARACQASLNKTSRNAYASIALQSKEEDMYKRAISYMEINLLDDENDLDAFLYLQTFIALLNRSEADNVLNRIETRSEGLFKKDELEKIYEYKALIEQFSGKYNQAIEDFTVAMEYGYDKLLAQYNIAIVYYSIAVDGAGSSFTLSPKVEWNSLRKCYSSLSDMLSNMPNDDIRDLLMPEILRIYLNCCMLLQEENSIYDKSDAEQFVWLLDYETIRSFIFSCPSSVIEERKYYEKLNSSDYILWKLNQSIQKEEYIQAENTATDGLKENKFLHPELAYDALLQVSLFQNDVDKYLKYRNEMISNGIMVPNYQMMEVCCLELSGKLSEATNMLGTLLDNIQDFSDFENAIRFYRRNNQDDDAIGVIQRIISLKKEGKIHIVHPNEFCRSVFGFLLENDFDLCCKFVEEMQSEKLNRELDLQVNLNIALKKNDFPRIAELSEKLYSLTKKAGHLLNSATAYLQYGNLDKSSEKLNQLIYQNLNQDERWGYNSLYSEIEFLRGNNDKAFKYAQVSHEDNMDRPKHPSHQHYFTVATRCGHIDEGLQASLEFKHENPIAVKYVKEIPSLTRDEEGNETLSEEFLNFIEEQRQIVVNWKKNYHERTLGLYQIADKDNGNYENLILQILSQNDSKISIFGGDISILNQEKECLKKNEGITIDVLSLIVLAHFDLLGLLDNFKKIYLGYSSFLFLQQAYFVNGEITETYRKVYDWIKNDNNCIKCADGPIDPYKNVKNIFPEHLLGAINLANETDTPLLYADYVESKFLRIDNITQTKIPELVSINAIVTTMEDETTSRTIRYDLMESTTFINFNAGDILFWIKKNNGVNKDSLQRFLTCDSTVDVESFASVYFATIKELMEINSAWAKEFTMEIIHNAEKVRRKGSYYEMTVEAFLTGNLEYTMPYVQEHIQKYLNILRYVNLVMEGIKKLFPNDIEVSREIEYIMTNNASAKMLLKALAGRDHYWKV